MNEHESLADKIRREEAEGVKAREAERKSKVERFEFLQEDDIKFLSESGVIAAFHQQAA